MDDRELLELAAKAVGIPVTLGCHIPSGGMWLFHADVDRVWSPLHNDGDALRLAADLCLSIEWFPGQHFVQASRFGIGENIGWIDEADRSGALRRAIVCAASEIGKSIQAAQQGHAG